MGLQKINWSQIDTGKVPNGLTVNIGSKTEPINSVYADNLYFTGTSIGDLFINNGSFNNGVITLTSNSGNTITISGISSTDTFISGATFENNQLVLSRNDGVSFHIDINNFTGLTVNGSISATTINTDNLVVSGVTITNQHNDLSGLQGGIYNEFYHLPFSGYTYLTDIVDNDKIGLILNAITVHPTYTSPSSSITNVTNTYEIGSSQTISITQTFNQGDGGSKISETINKNSSVVSTNSTFFENLVISSGVTIYNGSVIYNQGNCKVNNIGILDCVGRIVSGTTTSTNRIITGIYPVFYYKSTTPITDTIMVNAITGGTASKLVVSSTGTITLPFNLSSQYMGVAYPSTSTTKTVYYVTALDTGSITGLFPNLYTLNINSPYGYWSNVSYKIHTSNIINNSAANIELRNN